MRKAQRERAALTQPGLYTAKWDVQIVGMKFQTRQAPENHPYYQRKEVLLCSETGTF